MIQNEKKTRNRVKTHFMVSIEQEDGSLKVIKSGFNSYLEAERWCKNDASSEFSFSGAVSFFIFHAKKKIQVLFTTNDDNEDVNKDFEALIPQSEAPKAESPLPQNPATKELNEDFDIGIAPQDKKPISEELVPSPPAMPAETQQDLPGLDMDTIL